MADGRSYSLSYSTVKTACLFPRDATLGEVGPLSHGHSALVAGCMRRRVWLTGSGRRLAMSGPMIAALIIVIIGTIIALAHGQSSAGKAKQACYCTKHVIKKSM